MDRQTAMDTLFNRDPEPTSIEEFVAELNETRQGFIDAGFRVATPEQWAEAEAASARIQARAHRDG